MYEKIAGCIQTVEGISEQIQIHGYYPQCEFQMIFSVAQDFISCLTVDKPKC